MIYFQPITFYRPAAHEPTYLHMCVEHGSVNMQHAHALIDNPMCPRPIYFMNGWLLPGCLHTLNIYVEREILRERGSEREEAVYASNRYTQAYTHIGSSYLYTSILLYIKEKLAKKW
jgi:hypothetical protein